MSLEIIQEAVVILEAGLEGKQQHVIVVTKNQRIKGKKKKQKNMMNCVLQVNYI